MKILNIQNPFNAPVYHEETVSSTMDISRLLATEFPANGTVITADFQEAGRGRIRGRSWEMERGLNLPFTIMLRYPRIEDIPAALTLRAGLAVSLAVEDFILKGKELEPSVRGNENNERFSVMVKWPNDIMIDGKKAAGILCEVNDVYARETSLHYARETSLHYARETSLHYAHLGIGVNAAQQEFPPHLRDKATSIALAANREKLKEDRELELSVQRAANNKELTNKDMRFLLLEKILARLYDELETQAGDNWKSRLEQRLYRKGGQVAFVEGAADSGKIVKGCLAGIGDGGELLIVPEGEIEARSFITGELKV